MILAAFLAALPTWALLLHHLSLWYYLYARIVGNVSVFGLCFASMADIITDPEKRALAYGHILIILLPSLVLGPAFGLVLSTEWTFRAGIDSVL